MYYIEDLSVVSMHFTYCIYFFNGNCSFATHSSRRLRIVLLYTVGLLVVHFGDLGETLLLFSAVSL